MTCGAMRDLYTGVDVPVTTRALRAAVCRHLLSCDVCHELVKTYRGEAVDGPWWERLWSAEDLADPEFVAGVLGL